MSQVQKSKSLSKSLVVTLTSIARRRLPKPVLGFEQFLPQLLEVLAAHSDEMVIQGLDPDALTAVLKAYQASAADEANAEAALQKIKDSRLQQLSTVWSFMLEIYAVAKVVARRNPSVKQAIADFAAFMKRSRKKAATSPSTPTTPVNTTTPPVTPPTSVSSTT